MYIPPGLTDEQQAYFEKLDDDVQFFTRELFIEIGSEREDGTGKAPLSEFELDLVSFVASNGHPIKGVLGWRQIGKSHLIPGAAGCWRLLRDPFRKIVIVSKTDGTAKEIVGMMRSWMNRVWFLRHLAPRSGQLDNKKEFNTGPTRGQEGKQPSVKAMGMAGQLESNRAHTVIADDIETKENSRTHEARERLRSQFMEFQNWIYLDAGRQSGETRDPSEIILAQTPKHENTIASFVLKDLQSPIQAYPLCAPLPDEDTFPLSPLIRQRIDEGVYKPGDCLFPKRVTPAEVAQRRLVRSEWLREYQLVKTLGDADRYPLKLANFIVFDCDGDQAPISLMWGRHDSVGSTALDITSVGLGDDRFYRAPKVSEQWAPYSETRMRIDPAGKGSDLTGFAVISHLNGYYHFRRVGGLRGGATEHNFATLARIAYETNTHEIVVEANFGGDAYAHSLEIHVNRLLCKPGERPDKPSGWSCIVTTKPAVGNKESRIIDTIEPVLSSHRCVLSSGIASNTEFQTQISRITRDKGCLKNDDMVDAVAGCLSDFSYTFRVAPKDASAMESPEMKAWIERIQRKYSKSVSRFTAH